MRPLPSIDLHAHVDPEIASDELRVLNAVVFAAARSLDEADVATRRADEQVIWGVGCHPGLVKAQKAFDGDRFRELIQRSAFVSEVGLDGKSRVPFEIQQATLRDVLRVLQDAPRITSLHSYQASEAIIAELETNPIEGSVLHWWLGDGSQTRQSR